jgi:hypothetical protein
VLTQQLVVPILPVLVSKARKNSSLKSFMEDDTVEITAAKKKEKKDQKSSLDSSSGGEAPRAIFHK